jgi:pimeloyl-ACP methyl ester carboxylesterase
MDCHASRSRRPLSNGRIAALVVTATLLVSAPTLAAVPEYRVAPCTGGFARVAQSVACGILVIDETRGSGNGRRVAIPVAIVKAMHPRPGAVPVIYLHGGPGAGVVSGLPDLLRSPAGRELIAQDQDWIFFDQRGGLLSVPSLGCGSSVPLNDAGPLSAAAADALVACAARHVAAGVDLSAYNAVEVARDVQDLRSALNLNQFDLFGVSYGTRVAFTVLRTQATGVRAVVLDSVWPPEAKWAEGGPKMIADAVHLIFTRCAADRACHAAFPHADTELAGLARRLLSGPITLKGHTYTADDLGGFLMDTLYDAGGARALPRDAHAFAHGDYSALDAQMADRSPYVEAQHLAYLCKEEFPFERRDHVADGVDGDPIGLVSVKSFQRYFDVCTGFPVGKPDIAEGRPVVSDVPTLFLSAQFDPGCPPPLAQAAAARFARSQFIVIPNSTHGVFRLSPCARQMIRGFLGDPGRPVDSACLSATPERFEFSLK